MDAAAEHSTARNGSRHQTTRQRMKPSCQSISISPDGPKRKRKEKENKARHLRSAGTSFISKEKERRERERLLKRQTLLQPFQV